MKTPAETRDLNPFEMVWSALKDYFQKEAKPTTKADLLAVDVAKNQG